jgi:hypothetical protein
MTATAGFDIVKQLPETIACRPEAGASVPTASAQKDARRSPESEAGDFRANWQELLASGRALEEHPGSEETLKEEASLRNYADNDWIARRSFLDARSSQPALQIGQLIALGQRDLKTPKETQITRHARAPQHREGKDKVANKSEKTSPPLADAQVATGLIAAATTVASPISMPSQESVKQMISSLDSRSDAGSERFDAALSLPGTKDAIRQTATSVSNTPGRSAGEQGETADGAATLFFPAGQLATSDSDANRIANAPRPAPDLEPGSNGTPALHDNPARESRSLTAPQRVVADQDVPAPTFLQSYQFSTPISERASGETADAAPGKARSLTLAPNSAASVRTQPGHAAHDLVSASSSQHFASGAIQDSSMMLSTGSREISSSAGSVQAGKAGREGRELFTALDADKALMPTTWIRTGAHEAEAGYQDPDIGWVTVRAHTEANGVHASLVAGSTDAAQSLSSHLGGLSAYLADHHASVQHVSISSPEIQKGEQFPGQSMDQGTAQGRSQERQYGTGAEVEPPAGPASHPRAFVQRSEEAEPHAAAARGSRYISVVA